jgi:hypothetical protein
MSETTSGMRMLGTRIEAAAHLPLLSVADEAHRLGRYLPVDAAFAGSTVEEAAESTVAGPRGLGYGSVERWVSNVAEGPANPFSSLTDALESQVAISGQTPGVEPATESKRVVWRTLPTLAASRMLVGSFGDTKSATAALDKILEKREPALIAAELLDPVVARWLLGFRADNASTRVLMLRFEGDPEPVVRAYRQGWQALELGGGGPKEPGRGNWRWRSVHPNTPTQMTILRIKAAPETLSLVFDMVLDSANVADKAAVRAHAAMGTTYAYLPEGPRLDAARSWLEQNLLKHVGASVSVVERPAKAS